MSQDPIGLFDTPPTRRQVQVCYGIGGLLFILLIAVLTLPNVRLREINALVPVIDSIMMLSDLITATLLYVQSRIFRSQALTILASSFVFTALLLVIHLLTFPGAFAPQGLLDAGVNTAGWAHLSRRGVLPVAVILYVIVRRSESSAQPGLRQRPPRIAFGLVAAIALGLLAAILLTVGQDLLPPLFSDNRQLLRSNVLMWNIVLFVLIGAAMAALLWQRKSVLDLWLLAALAASLIQLPMNIADSGRFTLLFYAQFTLLPSSNLILMLALLTESSNLYAQVALSAAAQKRERDSRLMSMSAMAAMFAHETGQPITAVTTNSMAGISWLMRPEPNVEKAIKSLRASLAAGHRIADVINSLRGMIARQPGTISRLDFNALVRDTIVLLEKEVTAARVSLQLQLHDVALPVEADRIQIQQVVINLLINAVEALRETSGRPRRITVRSAPADGQVLLEISDSGAGVAPEDLERIFEPFVSTKASGTGLGLAICRMIVEEHGGRLWASEGSEGGAAFHLLLPGAGPSEA